MPDIHSHWAGFPVQHDVEAGYAAELTAAMADDWQSGFIDSACGAGSDRTVDGCIHMVPISLDVTNTRWHKTKICDENGLTPPATWEEFLAAIKTSAKTGEPPIFTGNNELWPLGNLASHVAGRTVSAADIDTAFRRQKTFAEAGFLRPLDLMQGLHEAGAFNRDMQGLGADPAMAAFFQKAAVIHPIGSWLVGSEGDLAEEGFAYCQFDTPVIDPAHAAPTGVIGTMTGFIQHAKVADPDAASAFRKYFTSVDAAVIWAESGAISPVKVGSEKALMSEQMEGMAAMLAIADAMVPSPDTAYPVPVAKAGNLAAAYAASGEKSAADALVWLDETVGAMPKP